MLVHLPNGHHAEAVRNSLIATIATLQAHLRGSLTWDQGAEMGEAAAVGLPRPRQRVAVHRVAVL
jgi:IS30 family transposase